MLLKKACSSVENLEEQVKDVRALWALLEVLSRSFGLDYKKLAFFGAY
jgi:hypothetical protein